MGGQLFSTPPKTITAMHMCMARFACPCTLAAPDKNPYVCVCVCTHSNRQEALCCVHTCCTRQEPLCVLQPLPSFKCVLYKMHTVLLHTQCFMHTQRFLSMCLASRMFTFHERASFKVHLLELPLRSRILNSPEQGP